MRTGSRCRCARALQITATLVLALSLAPVTTAAAAERSFAPDRWHQVAVPDGADNRTVAQLIGNRLPADEFGRSWAVFQFDTASNRYLPRDLNRVIAPGEGFWFQHGSPTPITLSTGSPARPPVEGSQGCAVSNCFEQPLITAGNTGGWMLVGAPVERPTRLAELRLVDSAGCSRGCTLATAAERNLVHDTLFGYNAATGGYDTYRNTDTLPAWQAVWLAVLPAAEGSSPRLLWPAPDGEPSDIVALNDALGRGINLGNALEAPNEGEWGITLEARYFDLIADAGFDSVRVPVRWSAHAGDAAPYTIDPTFFERVDWVLDNARRTGLTAIINMHHYEELMADPNGQRARYLALWQQIANRYADQPESVYFELLNEPTEAFDEAPALWNTLLAQALTRIRQTNPTRAVLVGPVGWNGIDRLIELRLPADSHLITTVHFYDPFEFTHQGADWVNPVPPVGASWRGDTTQLGSAFQDWSWETSVTAGSGMIGVDYKRGYAGFNLRSLQPVTARQWRVRVRGTIDVAVRCGSGDNFTTVSAFSYSGTSWRDLVADVSACPAGAQNFVLQNNANAAADFDLQSGELCDASACRPIVSTAAGAIADKLAVAQRWGQRNNRPMHLGEFGAYSIADMASRARWTAQVQQSAQAAGLSTAYWEFGSGFGAYDLATNRWNMPLLEALIGQ